MSSKGFQRPWCNGFGTKIVSFQVLPNGTSTPTIGENPDGVLASVSYDDVGVYTMTLNSTFLALVSHSFGLQLATAADSQVQLTSEDVAGAGTLTTTILTAGVAADIAANAGNIIHFTLVLRDSAQGAP
jgi:hypothetical protein